MRRRKFTALLGGTAIVWPYVVIAQQTDRMRKIGVLANEPWSAIDGLRQGLRELGYIEGHNLRLEYRYAEGQTERYPALAAELVALPVDAIVTTGTPAALAAKRATTTIPIVMATGGDPVGTGAVSNLARPGGNITGLSSLTSEVDAKRFELLREVLPTLSRVGVLMNPVNSFNIIAAQHVRSVAETLGVRLDFVEVSTEAEFDEAFRSLRRLHPDAVVVIADAFLLGHRTRIAQFMAESHLPAIYSYRDHVEAGGLMTYATNFRDLFRRAAIYVDKIFKGAKPGDLPIEQPTKFEFVINLNTAKALGLTIPPVLLARADEVIE
jgi:putative tryptophan/tyrosine transport system substrate-binding protein